MLKRLALGVLGLLVLAVVGLWLLAWRPSIDPIAPPAAASFPAELVQRGQVLAGAGYCATCHTAKGGAPYAGNYPMETAFGTLYASNITPDPDTGIGRWSQEAFVRAMRQGVARDGTQLFPAFPYQHFELVSDEDLHALYAFLMTRPAVHQEKRENELPFPLNWRALQAGWKLLFFRHGQYGPLTGKDAQWNRGAYLAEGLAHCSACHSPRNVLGAEKTGAARYDGARIDGWYAPPLNATNHAPVPWTQDELYAYLRTGATALHGSAAGPMSPVVHQGLSALSDEDVQAIAAYYAEHFGTRGQTAAPSADVLAKAMAGDALSPAHQLDQAANLYNAACASCHYNIAPHPQLARPELGLNNAFTADEPDTLIQVLLHGIGTQEGQAGVLMPGFAHSFSDTQIVALAAWLRRTRTDRPPWPDLEQRVAELHAQIRPGPQAGTTGGQ
ncbi:cytochrome c [Pseudoxanthomonas sp. X-1]|uniref:cytochrome c n=1 Tax=Pseudoxanthomonas sp. X-1 TaxID=2571115 RepID=UPI00110AECE7|nr:cytochrome c [Pseudoxanthomonas sp. X-1]TMN20636.1 c-type cytochrome [Pseudoxanthomonas sp. X-1]UAY75751.1 c-type cytochrome [Pseudoxanthomonas sp. X-1]